MPDDGLQLRIVSGGEEVIFSASPGNGLVADDPIEALPLVDVGRATGPLEVDLTGKAALIERGGTFFPLLREDTSRGGCRGDICDHL